MNKITYTGLVIAAIVPIVVVVPAAAGGGESVFWKGRIAAPNMPRHVLKREAQRTSVEAISTKEMKGDKVIPLPDRNPHTLVLLPDRNPRRSTAKLTPSRGKM